MGIPFGVSLFLWGGRCCVPYGWAGLFRSLGAQRPVGRLPGGGPRFSRETGGKRSRGESFSPLDSLLWFFRTLQGVLFFSAWPAAHFPTPVTARPPAGRAGKGGFSDGKSTSHRPKPSPWGEGAPVRTLGRMRGRPCTQPFLVEAEKGARMSPQRNFSPAPLGNPVAPSSVTSGDSYPPRGSLRRWYISATKSFLPQTLLPQNANPNQGTYMGLVIAQRPPRCAPPCQNERVPTSGP